jgi:hypothetical protein
MTLHAGEERGEEQEEPRGEPSGAPIDVRHRRANEQCTLA